MQEQYSDWLTFLCHDCHKKLTYDDVEGTDVPVGSELLEEDCPKCIIPACEADPDWLKNPLHRCNCGKLIFITIPDLFKCSDCMQFYEEMLLTVVDVMQANGWTADVHRELAIYEGSLGCEKKHNISIRRDVIYQSISMLID